MICPWCFEKFERRTGIGRTGKPFRINWQKYCGRECYREAKRFSQRMRFDQHREWRRLRDPEPQESPHPLFESELMSRQRSMRQKIRSLLHPSRPRAWTYTLRVAATLALVVVNACVKAPAPRVETPPNVVTKDGSNVYEDKASHDVGKAARTRPDRVVADISLLASGCQPGDSAYLSGSTPVHRRRYRCNDSGAWVNEAIIGGPSGAINCEEVPYECELMIGPTIKYVSTVQPVADAIPRSRPDGKLDPAWIVYPPQPAQQKVRTLLGWTGDSYVAASKTSYLTFGSLGVGAQTNRLFTMPAAGRFTRLMVRTRTVQSKTGSLQVILAIDGAATKGLTVIIPAGAPAGIYMNDGAVTIAERNSVQIQLNNAATAGSAFLSSITAVFEF